ncbi:hypothetical protein [Deinococcus sp.]|uniref:hypothetical protein n=1 Tax=Deinococcus sp. TaxID=47478 RepID=UPI00286DA116|nr:hypothetical protein [Deinococcus sp.]
MAKELVPYALEQGNPSEAAGVQRWRWQQDGDDWVKTGPCPRCKHAISKRLVMTSYLTRPAVTGDTDKGDTGKTESARVQRLRLPAPPGTVSIFCNCGVSHADGKSGCGFFVKDIAGPGGA